MSTDREIAAHLDLSSRSFSELRSKGIIPAGERDMDVCRVAYIRHMREMAAGRIKAPEANGLDVQRTRVAEAQAEELERRNAMARRELVPVEPVTAAMLTMIEVTKAKLKRVPAKVSQGDAALRSRISKAIEDALLDLSATGAAAVLERLAA